MPSSVELHVNGKLIRHWSSATITRTLDSFADSASFSFALHSALGADAPHPLTFDGGEPARVLVDGELVLTGPVVAASARATAQGSTIDLEVYSRTKDLVDCALVPKGRHFTDQTLLAIAEDICEPFAIAVDPAPGAVEAVAVELVRFSADFGDSLVDILRRLGEFGGLAYHAAPDGSLRMFRADHAPRVPVELVRPGNILEIAVSRDERDRFSHYIVVPQGAHGFDEDTLEDEDGRVAVVRDPGVSRYRPVVFDAESGVRGPRARAEQARWRRNRHAAETLRVTVRVQGLGHADGVWAQGEVVHVRDEEFGLDHDLLIVGARLGLDARQSTTELELVLPLAYQPREVPAPRRRVEGASKGWEQPPEMWEFEDTGFWEEHAAASGPAGDEL